MVKAKVDVLESDSYLADHALASVTRATNL